jgi:Domain of unknown function (DUF5679)
VEPDAKRFGLDAFKRVLKQAATGILMPTTAYCVKCKAKREIKNPQSVTMKNGKKAQQGTCPVCGTKLFRIGG